MKLQIFSKNDFISLAVLHKVIAPVSNGNLLNNIVLSRKCTNNYNKYTNNYPRQATGTLARIYQDSFSIRIP